MAGGEYLGFNNSIFLSERDSADRNNALAYFMRENHCFPPVDIKINDVFDFYFQVILSFYHETQGYSIRTNVSVNEKNTSTAILKPKLKRRDIRKHR